MDNVIEQILNEVSYSNIGTIFCVLLAIFSVVFATSTIGRMSRDDDRSSSLTFKHIRDALDAKRGGPPKKTFGRRLGKTPPIKKRYGTDIPAPAPTKTYE